VVVLQESLSVPKELLAKVILVAVATISLVAAVALLVVLAALEWCQLQLVMAALALHTVLAVRLIIMAVAVAVVQGVPQVAALTRT
jgi:hypothetical protein